MFMSVRRMARDSWLSRDRFRGAARDLGQRRIYNQTSKSTLGNQTRGPHMIYRKFGRTGLEVSDIAHGLWGMGGWSGSDDRESTAALQLAVDLGCNFFDSAW